MVRSLVVGIIWCFVIGFAHAQVKNSLERAALKSINKKHWAKAEAKLRKSINKDSNNALSRYVLAIYYFKESNPSYNLDSAYQYVIQSRSNYRNTSPRDQEKMKKFPLDSNYLFRLRKAIDSATFKLVKLQNQEQSYINFLQTHPFAEQRVEAVELRDEVAFLDAVDKNTYEAFSTYLAKYPSSAYATAAKRRYDKLLYEAMTRDGKLESYERFLHDHPETPFKKEIEKNIFELFTLTGDVERYLSFIQQYPASSAIKKAKDIVFHLLIEKESVRWPAHFLSDSLQNVLRLQQNYMVPFLKGSKFGFMDKNGTPVIPPLADELNDEYICGNITEDVIALPGKLIGRNGNVFFSGAFREIDELGHGFLKLQSNGCHTIIHKSGFVVDSCATDAKLLEDKFLSVTKNGKSFLTSLAGRKILPEGWDEINLYGKVVALKNEGVWNLLTLPELLERRESGSKLFANTFEEIRFLNAGNIWVKQKGAEGILDQNLQEVVPVNTQKVIPVFFGYTGQSISGFTIYNQSGRASSYFDKVTSHDPWVAVNKNGESFLFNTETRKYISNAYDSIHFEGPFALGSKGDSLVIHFNKETYLQFVHPVETRFVPGKDSTSFIAIKTTQTLPPKRGKKATKEEITTVYNLKAKKLFSEVFDDIQFAGSDLFILSRKEKKGLVDASGNILLPFEYDAIGSVNGNTISLLRSMKFGLYNVNHHSLIRPDFDKNLVAYGENLVVAYRDGLYGFVQWDQIKNLKVEFDEVRNWNDSIALVRKNDLWNLYDVNEKVIREQNLKEFKMIEDTQNEKVAIVQRDESFGVFSNKRGVVIPVTFSDLVNVGSSEEPLYFTEKHVSEASIFVVIYYDRNGKLLRREIYEEAEDYEKIYCSGN